MSHSGKIINVKFGFYGFTCQFYDDDTGKEVGGMNKSEFLMKVETKQFNPLTETKLKLKLNKK